MCPLMLTAYILATRVCRAMKTILGSFLLAVLCTAISLVDAMLKIGGYLGLLIGALPLGAWLIIVPFYIYEEKE